MTTLAGPDAGMNLFSDVIAKESKQAAMVPGFMHAPPGSTHRVTIEQAMGGAATEWRPVPFNREVTGNMCFGCQFGMSDPDETQPTLKQLWQIFKDNYARQRFAEHCRTLQLRHTAELILSESFAIF